MKLSTKSRYGTRLLLDMAEHYGEGPVQLGDIARRQDISVKYLEQIIIPLKKAGYVKSVRGPRGGHMLAKSPGEITVGEVVTLLEEGPTFLSCSEDEGSCARAETCPTRLLWKEAAQALFLKLDEVTLADLMKRAKSEKAEPGSLHP